MKNFIAIFVLCFVALSFNGFSQIKVSSNGMVGINMATPTHNLDWYGTGQFWAAYGQLIFDSSGYGGVATIHPNEDWIGCLGLANKRFNNIYVDHVLTRQLTYTSDETVKENIKTLSNSLEKVKKLRGVQYNIKSEYFNVKDENLKKSLVDKGKDEIGFLAQELKEVFPGAVYLDPSNNLYSVNYIQIIPVLVEAIKEQQAQIDELKKLVTK